MPQDRFESTKDAIFISYRRSTCRKEAEVLYYYIRAAYPRRTIFYDEMIEIGSWRSTPMKHILGASLVILLISNSTLATFRNTGQVDNLMLEWDIAIRRYREGEISLLPVIVQADDDRFRFNNLSMPTVPAADCELSPKEIWDFLSRINMPQINFLHKHDLQVLLLLISRYSIEAESMGVIGSRENVTFFSNLIDEPRYFFGREYILAAIDELFADVTRNAAIILHGGPGLGKSYIMMKYVSKLRSDVDSKLCDANYSHVLFLNFVSEKSFFDSIIDCGKTLGLPREDNSRKLRAEVFRWLEENERYLVILDHVNIDTDIDRYLPGLKKIRGHVIITSRNRSISNFIPLEVDVRRIIHVQVNSWPKKISHEYAEMRLSGMKDDEELRYLDQILDYVDGFPFVIDQLCAYLNLTHDSCEQFYHKLVIQDRVREGLGLGTSSYLKTYDSTFTIIVDCLRGNDSSVDIILGAIGCVSPRNIPVQYLQKVFTLFGCGNDMETSLSQLVNVSIVTMDADRSSISIHPLIQEAILRTLHESDFVRFEEQAVTSMIGLFPKFTEFGYDPGTIVLGTSLLSHIEELYVRCPRRDLNLASLTFEAGNFAKYTSLFEFARKFFLNAFEIYREIHGTKFHAHVADSIAGLAAVQDSLGAYDEAKKLYLECLEINQVVYATNTHPGIANILSNLAAIADIRGDYDEAEKLYNECLSIEENVYGSRLNINVAATLNNLGSIAKRREKFTDAKKLLTECVEIKKSIFGTTERASIATTINNLGSIAQSEGRYEEAKKQFEEALIIFEREYGTKVNLNVAIVINNLGSVAKSQGNYDEARRLFVKCLEYEEQIYYTRYHPTIATSLGNIASIDFIQGKYASAATLVSESISILENAFENRIHPSVASWLHFLALIHEISGNFESAKETYKETLDIYRDLFGTDSELYIAVAGKLIRMNVPVALPLEARNEQLTLAPSLPVLDTDENRKGFKLFGFAIFWKRK